MTVTYTDPETGKKYDRQLRGVCTDDPKDDFDCTGCAFRFSVSCPVDYCMYTHPSDLFPATGKRVYFVFKERKA